MANKNTATRRPKTKLLPHEHSGRLRPHHHTSYGGLLLILLLAAVPILFASHQAAADNTGGQGAEQVYAVVPAALPKAPTITSQASGKVLTSTDPVPISGKCTDKSLVKVFKNDVLTGAALCAGRNFTLNIDLFVGDNNIIARAYNANDLPGPDSAPLLLKLQLPGVNLNAAADFGNYAAPGNQFYLTTEVYYRGVKPGVTLTWPLTIAGGQAPYALNVSWGDGKTELMSRAVAGTLSLSHAYDKAANYSGSYTIVIKGIDAQGSSSMLQLVAIVPASGQTATAASTTHSNSKLVLQIAGQIVLLCAAIVISFWIGEKRELAVLKHRHIPGAV